MSEHKNYCQTDDLPKSVRDLRVNTLSGMSPDHGAFLEVEIMTAAPIAKIETRWTEPLTDGGTDVCVLFKDNPNLHVARCDKNGKQTHLTIYEGMTKNVINMVPIS